MKKTVLFLLVVQLFGVLGCYNNPHNLISLQPGHFCQVGAIAVSGDTIFIAGSFIPEDNPNLTTQPVHGYIVALSTDGKTIWEKKANEPDYIRWMHIDVHKAGYLAISGYQDSPLSGLGMKLRQVTTINGSTTTDLKPAPRTTCLPLGIQHLEKHKFLSLYSVEDSGTWVLKEQIATIKAPISTKTLLSNATAINSAGILPNGSVYAATGNPSKSGALAVSSIKDSLLPVTLPLGFDEHLINEMLLAGQNYLAATTIKNGQGPCIWQLTPNDTAPPHTCLNYWPYHGSVKILPHNNCTVAIFNASDATNERNAHLVVLDQALQPIWEQTIDTEHPFIIKDVAANSNNIYIGGTLEMGENGSAMAIKIITLPKELGCNQVSMHQ